MTRHKDRRGRKEGEKGRPERSGGGDEKGFGRRKEEESCEGRRNNEGLKPSEAHGSGCTSVPPACGQQLHAAQRVGAESLSQNSKPPCRSRGEGAGWHLQSFFFSSFLFH